MRQAQKGQIRTAEDALMFALDQPDVDFEQWVPVLELIVKACQDDSGEVLGWAALDVIQERMDPREAIPHCGKILRLFSKNDEFRTRAVELYLHAYATVPHFDSLVEISGLEGGKPIRRALQTLDICLAIEPGSCLVPKHDGPVAKVISIEHPAWNIRLHTPSGEELYDAVTLGDQYELAGPHDFRVLQQFDPERLAEILQSQPGEIVLAIVKKHGNEMTTNQLESLLCPRSISGEDWSKWWSKARAALRKNPRVRLEGRNPVTIRYEDKEISIEDEIWERLNPHAPPKAWLALAQEYLRECKHRGRRPEPSFLIKLREAVRSEAVKLEKQKTAQALPAWLTVGEITRLAGEENDDADAIRVINEVGSLRGALFDLSDVYWPMLLAAVKKGRPDTWAEDFVTLLPITPPNHCDDLVEQICDSGKEQLLGDVVPTILAEPLTHLKGLCWLYQGPKNEALPDSPPLTTLLSRLLNALEETNHSTTISRDLARDLCSRVRNTLCARKYRRFAECLEQIEEGMANALRTQIRRATGLSAAVKSDLISRIHYRFPTFGSKPQKQPWEDSSVIYCTQAGLSAEEAELKELVSVKMKENAAAIGEAASHGDLSENAEYKCALEERDLLRSRVAEIQNQLALARVICSADAPLDHVGIGSRVVFRNLNTGEPLTLTFWGPWESDVDEHVLNYQAPISQRIMGLRVGESLDFEFGPHSGSFEVVSIEPGLE